VNSELHEVSEKKEVEVDLHGFSAFPSSLTGPCIASRRG